jgi:hypothetical protein
MSASIITATTGVNTAVIVAVTTTTAVATSKFGPLTEMLTKLRAN